MSQGLGAQVPKDPALEDYAWYGRGRTHDLYCLSSVFCFSRGGRNVKADNCIQWNGLRRIVSADMLNFRGTLL
jgi:hypothetical protein